MYYMHHRHCHLLLGNYSHRCRVPSSSSKAMTIHVDGMAWHRRSAHVNSFLVHQPCSYAAPFNRRRCVGLRLYCSYNDNDNGKHNFRRGKVEELDDDQPQPMIISSRAAPPDPSPPLQFIQQQQQEEKPVSIIPGPDDDDDDQSPQLLQLGNSAILSACFVGLFTGVAVVLFNYAVHEIRDLCWGGIPDQGASWLREQPIQAKWESVILVPAFGGLIVSLLNMIRTAIEDSTDGTIMSNIKSTLKPVLKSVAACITLGTGNSLGPEGPSVEIGVSVAKGVGAFLDKGAQKKLSLRAAGSAAGISSGFNAAVAGCFFAVESVLWPSPSESSLSLTNTTSMVILSAVIASIISEIGLGSEPAFAVPVYDFRSPSGRAYACASRTC